MDRDEALETLRAHREVLQAKGVARAAIFGSTARGEATPDSDVDVLVELDPSVRLDYFGYAGLKLFIAELFPVPADVAERAALRPHVRPSAERDAIYAF